MPILLPSQAAPQAQARLTPADQQTTAYLASLTPQTNSAKPTDATTGMNDLPSNGLTDAYFISLGQQQMEV